MRKFFSRILAALLLCLSGNAFAAISILQEAATSTLSSTTTATATLGSNATVGSTIEVWVTWEGTGANAPTGVADGASQSYTAKGSVASDGYDTQAFSLYVFQNNASATALTVTATWSVAPTHAGVWIKEIGGAASVSYQTSATNYQATPGTSANAIVSGNVTPSSQPCLLSGLSAFPYSPATNTLAVGTSLSFVSGTTGWGTNPPWGVSESIRLTSTSAVQAAYTDATNGATGHYLTGVAIYTEASAAASSGLFFTFP